MATYAIGDIQGCFHTLLALLQRVGFREAHDRLWLVGDLVNRGPRSLDVLRFVRDLGDHATSVLGNHDLHLIASALGVASPKARDTVAEVLRAPDAEHLIAWLRARPLLFEEGGYALVHAGWLPGWDDATAAREARAIEAVLRSDGAGDLLRRESVPAIEWDEHAPDERRLRASLAAFTRMRTCSSPAILRLDFSGPPEHAPLGSRPWFELPSRRGAGKTVLFGHWAALGFRRGEGYVALDSGCVWGRALTALRLDDGAVFQEPAIDAPPAS
jgi:bis(5'-nucleosyl)-tetraphosphatase (symmetrical)